MAYLYQSSDEQLQDVQKQDEAKQDNAILTNASGDLGAEPTQGTVSGTSERPRDAARQANVGRSQVLERNQGKAANPFQFDKTRQALSGARSGIASEKDQYMANAVAPFQYGQEQVSQVQNWARDKNAKGQPDWMARYQQGTPQAPGQFKSNVQTNFAPVEALKTNAGVRNYLRDPLDPEARGGEAAVDFSLINADPNFNIQREDVLRNYGDLLGYQNEVEANTASDARKAQLDAFAKYREGISGTLGAEAQAIEDAAKQAESAYDVGFGSLDRNALARAEIEDIYKSGPANLRPYLGSGIGQEYDQFFNPLTAESTKAEDFVTEDQATNFNRIMAALGREGKIATKGRLAGQKGPGSEALQFDRNAFRNKVLNDAFARANAPSPFAGTDAYNAGPALPKLPQPGIAPPMAGTLAIPTEMPYVNPMTMGYTPVPEVNPYMGPIMPGTLNIGYSDGGRVPGVAPEDGDSPANDIVSASLSPGEIVIPRSAAEDKESAKEFIDNLPFSKTRALLKNKYNCGGMVKGYAEGGVVGDQIEKQYDDQYNAPIPGAKQFKQGVDEALTKYVVDPLAERGYENLGAGLATIPSTLMEAAVPSTAGDALMAITPFPKIKGVLKRGTSEALPKTEAPKMPQFETVSKAYNEKMLDPIEEAVTKVLSAFENQGLSPEQKQALANYVRVRMQSKDIDNIYLNNLANPSKRNDYDFGLMNPYNMKSHNYNEPYDAIEKNFPRDKNVERLHPVHSKARKIINEILSGQEKLENPKEFQRRYMYGEEKKQIQTEDSVLNALFGNQEQKKMYEGRPSAAEEFEKYGKTKEVLKNNVKKQGRSYTQGKYKIVDWAGKDMSDFGTFDSFDDAYEYLVSQLEKKYSEDELEEILSEFSVVERNAKKKGGR